MTATIQQKRQAHAMLDLLPAGKLPAAVGLLGGLLDPVDLAILNAPIDEEPLTPEEEQALAESHEWRKHNEPTPHDVVLTELGITAEEIEIYREPV